MTLFRFKHKFLSVETKHQLFSSSVHFCVCVRERYQPKTTFTTVTLVLLSLLLPKTNKKWPLWNSYYVGFWSKHCDFFYIIVFTVLEINELKQDCKVPDSNVSTPFRFYLQTCLCSADEHVETTSLHHSDLSHLYRYCRNFTFLGTISELLLCKPHPFGRPASDFNSAIRWPCKSRSAVSAQLRHFPPASY